MSKESNIGSVVRGHYAISTDETKQCAEIKMYGQVVRERPTDFWTGKEIEGDFIISSEFVKDIESLDKCKKLNIRLDSLGGDVHAAIVIHNRLRDMARNGTEINCVVDGVAMSAGSMIMCAADHVSVSEESLIMIHKSSVSGFFSANADELRKLAEENDKYDEAIMAAYKRKTGLDDKELLAMMSEETYMTGKEAVEKGFADEIFESGEKLEIAASADGRSLMINGRVFPLFGMPRPENLPLAKMPDNTGTANKSNAKNTDEEAIKIMAKNLSELRSENPELAAAVEKEILAARADENKTAESKAAAEAVEKERARLAEIDEIAQLYDPETVKTAKYGENACSAAELAYRAARENAKKGEKYLENVENDFHDSGADGIQPVSPPKIGAKNTKTEEEHRAEARAFFEQFKKEDGKV